MKKSLLIAIFFSTLSAANSYAQTSQIIEIKGSTSDYLHPECHWANASSGPYHSVSVLLCDRDGGPEQDVLAAKQINYNTNGSQASCKIDIYMPNVTISNANSCSSYIIRRFPT